VNSRLLIASSAAALWVAAVYGQVAQQPANRAAQPPASRPVATAPAQSGAPAAAPAADATSQRAVIDKYCVGCHNSRAKVGGLALDALDLGKVQEHAELVEKIVLKLRAGMMPPSGAQRPDPATLSTLIASLEGALDRNAPPNLEAPGLHRLNRTEYSNAVRDLIGLEVDASKFLPADDSTRGFDNIAAALTISPALMEAYLSAAGKISRLAIGDAAAPAQYVYDVPADTAQNYRIEGLPFGTRGGILIEHNFPTDGEYSFNVKGVTGYFQAVLGQITGEKLEVMVDGELLHVFDWDRDVKSTTGNGKSTPRFAIKAGQHSIGVTFVATNDLPATELNRPFQRTMNTPGEIPGFLFYPHVGQVVVEGPYNANAASDTPSRRAIFTCQPASVREEEPCARQIITRLVKRAFRRPATKADLDVMMEFYRQGRNEEGTFDDGIEAALQRILADVEFVYRGEPEPTTLAAGKSYRIGDLALASRLSFFLWSSIPDDELIDVAAAGRLREPATLEKQVKRMLADPKSAALVSNFTGQWLSVRALATSEPVVNIFPDFDDNLRAAFQREIELFFASVLQEDRSVTDLLDANYTFVNERLAKHYGIPGVYGPQFRRVTLPASLDHRRGLIGKGALLTVTSQAARTSPVMRGKWVLTTFFGIEPPPPPPDVDTSLKEKVTNGAAGNDKIPTMRQILEKHHAALACAQCHRSFEPFGLALENFDATGAWRMLDEGNPIDTVAVMNDGTKIDGVPGLRQSLLRYQEQFVRVVTEKMLTYALGRGLGPHDMPLVRSLVRDAAPTKYRMSSLVLGIVKSPAFQMNMKSSSDRVEQTAAR
jgi:mono/diheme cytochrome c family protein